MKILASDFDKTLFVEDLNTLKENIERIKEWRNQGNLFVIATGRNFPFLIKDIEAYQIPFDYAICNDGGKIFDNKKNCLFTKDIPLNCNQKIINRIKENSNISEWWIDSGNGLIKDETKRANAIIARPIEIEKAYPLLEQILKENQEVHGYISDNWINITEKTVTKKNGLLHLLEWLNLESANLYTIGDNDNDFDMITSFNGAIMENHNPSLDNLKNKTYKSVANYIDALEKKEQ